MKKIVSIFLAVIILVFSVNVMAAPVSLAPADAVSTTSGILTVTNPSAEEISSYDKTHNISGYAASGVNVSINNLKGGVYQQFVKDGEYVSFTVGASGMFIKPVTLGYGKNELLIRAEVDGKVQYVKRTITVLSFNLFNLFKGFNLF